MPFVTGAAEWPLQLTPWWASVLPVLARQHQQHISTAPLPQTTRAPPAFLHPQTPSTQTSPLLTTSSSLLNKIKSERSRWPDSSRETSPSTTGWSSSSSGTSGRGGSRTPPACFVGLDQLSLVTALGKEVSPQMVLALQAVASRRESFSSAAKLYSVSVTTLWRYFKKLNLAGEAKKEAAAKQNASSCIPNTFIP